MGKMFTPTSAHVFTWICLSSDKFRSQNFFWPFGLKLPPPPNLSPKVLALWVLSIVCQ